MENIDNVVKEFNNVSDQILSGEYDDAKEIMEKYINLKKQLESVGIKILDGIDFNTLIL